MYVFYLRLENENNEEHTINSVEVDALPSVDFSKLPAMHCTA